LRDAVSAGGVTQGIAQDRDRFSREPAHHYVLGEEFLQHGTSLKALNDYGDDSPEGVLTDGILDQLAKFERAKSAERTRRGRMRKAQERKLRIQGNGGTASAGLLPSGGAASEGWAGDGDQPGYRWDLCSQERPCSR
jgi:DNA invertase Pin-like site-specific DNA recombinase